MRIDDIIRDEIAGLGIGLTKGTNLFGPDAASGPGVPNDAVFVTGGGGATPNRASGGDEIRTGVVNIRVRWRKYDAGATKAQQIIDKLQGKCPSALIDLESTESEPNYIGQEQDGQHIWSLGFLVRRNKDAP